MPRGRAGLNAQTFWHRLTLAANGCREWSGAKTQSGYGVLRWGGRRSLAHRVAFEITKGPAPDGLAVCHHCDNPSCCNPDHLFLSTSVGNSFDAVFKGRNAGPTGVRAADRPGYERDRAWYVSWSRGIRAKANRTAALRQRVLVAILGSLIERESSPNQQHSTQAA